jgi:hypothetical protein
MITRGDFLLRFLFKSKVNLLIATSTLLSACVGGVQSPSPQYYENLAGTLEVTQVGVERVQRDSSGRAIKDSAGRPVVNFLPINEQMRVNPDEEIRITFNRRIDSYSARPENFELFTDEGARVPGNVTPTARFVPDPSGAKNSDGSPVLVSQLKLRPPNRFFLPMRRYFLMWRASPEGSANAPAELTGIRDESGTVPLISGSTTFITSNQYSDSSQAFLKIRAITPGKLISGGSFGSESLRDAISSYTTWVANTPIRVLFTEPIRHFSETTSALVQRPEIPPTPISQFGGMVVGVLSSSTMTSGLLQNMSNAMTNTAAWNQFVQQNFYQQLSGKVRTENGRRVLVFELDPGTTYPDDIAQAIVVVVNGFFDLESFGTATPKALENNGMAVGAFLHFSGVTLPTGFQDPRALLFNFLGGGGL